MQHQHGLFTSRILISKNFIYIIENEKEIKKKIVWKTSSRMSIFWSNASFQIKCQQQHHEFDIRIIFTSIQIMLISNKKYAHSKNELISNWIDDLTFNMTFNNFLQHWSFSSKSHVNCDFFAFSLIIYSSSFFSSSFFEFFFSSRSLWHLRLQRCFVRLSTRQSLKLFTTSIEKFIERTA